MLELRHDLVRRKYGLTDTAAGWCYATFWTDELEMRDDIVGAGDLAAVSSDDGGDTGRALQGLAISQISHLILIRLFTYLQHSFLRRQRLIETSNEVLQSWGRWDVWIGDTKNSLRPSHGTVDCPFIRITPFNLLRLVRIY